MCACVGDYSFRVCVYRGEVCIIASCVLRVCACARRVRCANASPIPPPSLVQARVAYCLDICTVPLCEAREGWRGGGGVSADVSESVICFSCVFSGSAGLPKCSLWISNENNN